MAQVIPIGNRSPDAPGRCRAMTVAGKRCRNPAVETGFCASHLPKRPERLGPFDADWAHDALDFMKRRLTGEYEIDEFGFDAELTEKVFMRIARPFYEQWWRIDWIGMENVPSSGPGLLVSNHAGVVPWDAVMMKFGILDKHPAHRHVRLLAADLVFRTMFLGSLARKTGNTLACEEDTYRLLSQGELIGVFPEGYKGVGKPFKERYKLQRFGRGGFIQVALKAKTPIIPVSIVGSEEIYPMIANMRGVARLGGFPYFPVTPFFPLLGPLGAIPLPSKWIVEFGEPIHTEEYPDDAYQDAMLVFDLTDRVRDTIQQTLHKNLVARRGIFS